MKSKIQAVMEIEDHRRLPEIIEGCQKAGKMIYFAQADVVGHIKIGFTNGVDATVRLQDLQVGSPVKLTLLGTIPGDQSTERDLHRQFAFAHLHGEWFKACPEILQTIGKATNRDDLVAVTRFVSVKVMTVNGKGVTKAFFNQIVQEDIIDWDDLSRFEPEEWQAGKFLKGIPWGRVNVPDARFALVWQKDGELRRDLVSFAIPECAFYAGFHGADLEGQAPSLLAIKKHCELLRRRAKLITDNEALQQQRKLEPSESEFVGKYRNGVEMADQIEKRLHALLSFWSACNNQWLAFYQLFIGV